MAAAIRSRKVLNPFVALARAACDNAVRRPDDAVPARAMLADALEDAPGAPAFALDWQADIARGLDALRRGRRPDGRGMLRRMARAGLIRWDDIPEHRAALALHAALANLPAPLPARAEDAAVPKRGRRLQNADRLRFWLRAVLGPACPGIRHDDWSRTLVLLPCRQDLRSVHDAEDITACAASMANDQGRAAFRALIAAGFPSFYYRIGEPDAF